MWREKDDLLRTVPGVGEQLSLTLLAYVPDLGTLDRRQIAARVRAAVYMGPLVATRCNPVLRTFYQRLLAAGKAKKVDLVARMRKLLTILNSMVKSGKRWNLHMISC